MYEVEIKIELIGREKEDLLAEFEARGFEFKGLTPQTDVYVEAKNSPHGGMDLKRFRNENGKYIYTEKIWEMVGGGKVRRENEHEVSKDEFDSAAGRYPDALKITKDREWYAGHHEGKEISLTVDAVKFDHSPEVRYFLEAEIDVEESADVAENKKLIKEFLKELLHKDELIEAPGMFMMALEKK